MSVGQFTVAILIGGDSSRMGVDKATFEIDGISMANRVSLAAHEAGATQVLIVGGTAARAKTITGTWKRTAFPVKVLLAASSLPSSTPIMIQWLFCHATCPLSLVQSFQVWYLASMTLKQLSDVPTD